jgi:hypothetical protein
MKTCLRRLITLTAWPVLVPMLHAADPAPPAPRAPLAPALSHEQRSFVRAEDDGTPRMKRRIDIRRHGPVEMETVPFLGVETGPVDPTLCAQLGLDRGTGLVVRSVLPDTPAAGVLTEHDILLKLNDQILIDLHQLAVLVRNLKPGDEVTLAYLRAGKPATAKVKLAEHKVPVRSDVMYFSGGAAAPAVAPLPGADADHLLWMMDLGREDGARAVVHRRVGGDRTVAVTVNTRDGTMDYSDDEGALEIVTKDGKKTLTAKDAGGKVIFKGPVNTTEEKAKLPSAVAERLRKIEDMQDFQFHTDRDFEGDDTRGVRPLGQDVRLSRPPAMHALRRLGTM